jgi:hypothetical protein
MAPRAASTIEVYSWATPNGQFSPLRHTDCCDPCSGPLSDGRTRQACSRSGLLLGEHVESLEKPVGDRILQAVAQAYPDAVDPYLLSMVLGCDPASLHASAMQLVESGLAESQVLPDAGDARSEVLTITEQGMAVADGMAADAHRAAVLLERLEAAALRQLLEQRIRANLPPAQAAELRGSLGQVSDSALMDGAKVWAHQAVSEWGALVQLMQAPSAHLRSTASA